MPQPQLKPVRLDEPGAEAVRDEPAVRAGASHGRLLAIALACATVVWIVGWHAGAALSMASTWWHSETFAHGLIVYPASAWLIWRKRAELRSLPAQPSFLALLPFAAAVFAALLGDVGGVEAARQFGLVAMVALAVVIVLGRTISHAIAFPLAFTLLAVPVGEFMLPMLMEHTADFTVAALRLSGIPVYREGLFFTVPSGRWSVVEACSGLRYLIASLTLGLLYAYLSYRSPVRRVLFVVASAVVPVVANWIRAYTIVMIGHLSDMRLAVGVDHLIYGWVFFGIVMLLLFWIGSWWREDGPEDRPAGPAQPVIPATVHATEPKPAFVAAALCAALLAAAGPVYVGILDENERGPIPSIAIPAESGQWQSAPSRLPRFTPHFLNGRSTVHQTYEAQGRQVGLFVAHYRRQTPGSEMIGFGNGLVRSGDPVWKVVSGSDRFVVKDLKIVESRLQSAGVGLVTWRWYWAGGRWSSTPEEVKLLQAFDRLLGRGDDTAVVVVYTTEPLRQGEAESLLQDFVVAMEPAIRAALQAVRAQGQVAGDGRRGFYSARERRNLDDRGVGDPKGSISNSQRISVQPPSLRH